MKISAMLGQRFKETPAECKIDSHIFMIRGGYMKRVGEGIYSLLPPGLRIVKKIENIIREEMNKIDENKNYYNMKFVKIEAVLTWFWE